MLTIATLIWHNVDLELHNWTKALKLWTCACHIAYQQVFKNELTQSNVLFLDSGFFFQFTQGVCDYILLFKKTVGLIFDLGEHFVWTKQ